MFAFLYNTSCCHDYRCVASPALLSINRYTTGLGAHLPLSVARSRLGGTLTPCSVLISLRTWYTPHSLGNLLVLLLHVFTRCGMHHTCWLIHHLWDVLLPPLLLFLCRVCCCYPQFYSRVHPTTLVPFTAKYM